MASGRATIYVPSADGALRQGELLSGIVRFRRVIREGASVDEPEFVKVTHPFAVVVSQDCDLDWDFKARQDQGESHKLLPDVLFCEVVEAGTFRGRSDIKSDIWRRIKGNKEERYQYIESVPADLDKSGKGVPDLALDFKRYFCVATDDVYSQLDQGAASRRCCLVSPYAEHLASRFFYFQSRVALPRDHGQESPL